MTNWKCSACGDSRDLTMIMATIICLECLQKASQEALKHNETLQNAVNTVVKETDPYA